MYYSTLNTFIKIIIIYILVIGFVPVYSRIKYKEKSAFLKGDVFFKLALHGLKIAFYVGIA